MVFGDNTTAAAFIGASVTLVLIIIFMILMVILIRQCLAFMAKRNSIRQQIEQHRQQRAEMERQRRLSISEPVDPTFDWHHSIRIAGTPPPSYREAKKLPPLADASSQQSIDKLGCDHASDISITMTEEKVGTETDNRMESESSVIEIAVEQPPNDTVSPNTIPLPDTALNNEGEAADSVSGTD
uniref:Uncharacterized protein n=1 Tax=Amphimedon queenslandica TaxID=400682 RepID=A0A1X7UJR2_AMPQE